MPDWVKWIQEKVQPQMGWPLSTPEQFVKHRELQALWIGIIAFSLPLILFIANLNAPCFRDSISHSYYMPFWGDIFVALITFVGIFLMFYRGQSRWERFLARLAGVSAIIVAIIPTSESGCEITIESSRLLLHDLSNDALSTAFQTKIGSVDIHIIAAATLFILLTVFNLFVFTATDQNNPIHKSADNRNKRYRNSIYQITGLVMSVTIGILTLSVIFPFNNCNLGFAGNSVTDIVSVCNLDQDQGPSFWDMYNVTFYLEWLVLFCFSTAWIIKGRAGGVLFRDDKPDQIVTPPQWWIKKFG